MLVITIFGILATFGFRKSLKDKGYPESRGWLMPLFIGSFLLCFAYLLNLLSGVWISDQNSNMARIYPYIVSVLAILVHGLLVSRLWKQVQKLPDISDQNKSVKRST